MDKITKVLQLEKSIMIPFDEIRTIGNDVVLFVKNGIYASSMDMGYFKHKLRLRYKLNDDIDTIFYKLID